MSSMASSSAGQLHDYSRLKRTQDGMDLVERVDLTIINAEDRAQALRMLRNDKVAISALPNELICNIVSLLPIDVPDGQRLTVLHVCRRWRRLLLHTMQLRFNISLDSRRMSEMLSISKLAGIKATAAPQWASSHDFDRRMENIHHILTKELHRVVSLSIHPSYLDNTDTPRLFQETNFLDLKPVSIHRLEQLDLGDWYPRSVPDPGTGPFPNMSFCKFLEDCLEVTDTPSLRRMTLSCVPSWDCKLLHENLRSLIILRTLSSPTLAQFFSVLKRISSLEELRVEWETLSPHEFNTTPTSHIDVPHKVVFPNLRHLTLDQEDATQIIHFLRHLHLSPPLHLDLWTRDLQMGDRDIVSLLISELSNIFMPLGPSALSDAPSLRGLFLRAGGRGDGGRFAFKAWSTVKPTQDYYHEVRPPRPNDPSHIGVSFGCGQWALGVVVDDLLAEMLHIWDAHPQDLRFLWVDIDDIHCGEDRFVSLFGNQPSLHTIYFDGSLPLEFLDILDVVSPSLGPDIEPQDVVSTIPLIAAVPFPALRAVYVENWELTARGVKPLCRSLRRRKSLGFPLEKLVLTRKSYLSEESRQILLEIVSNVEIIVS